MQEPDVLDATIECPDCFGSGEMEYEGPGCSVDLEPPQWTDDCNACGGSGQLRLGDLPAAEGV